MRSLLMLLLFAVLAACSRSNEHRKASATPQQAAAAAKVKLPGGIRFDLPSQLRTDTTYQTRKGTTRRRVTYELLEVAPERVRSLVVATMIEAGYAADEAKPNKRNPGQYSIFFRSTKKADVKVIFYPELPRKPANPAAKSMIAFDWQTRKAPRSAKRPVP